MARDSSGELKPGTNPWDPGYDAPQTGTARPPSGRGGGPAFGSTPFGGYEYEQDLSPLERELLEKAIDDGVSDRLARAKSIAPSVRQQAQSELINLTLVYERLGNPYSQRRIPFSVLRDMATDPMIYFAHHYTTVPIVRANWHIDCPDAQIAAAADEALRATNPILQVQLNNKLLYGYQPMCKRFKLGKLGGFYRDPQGDDPLKDLPIWDSDQPALLWDTAYVLAPEHVMPRWNERGGFAGFYWSIIPLPNPIQIGIANLYGYAIVPGFEVNSEFAMWAVNEKQQNFGSLYGSPRTVRAYRYWWSYWYRWALADRAFENAADPAKIVYYPTDIDQVIDPEDPALASNPTVKHMQQVAINLGQTARSGATVAVPGSFVVDDMGKMTSIREWEITYLKPETDFAALASSFAYLDSAKFRSMLVPEEAFIQGGQSSSGSKGGTSRLMGIQLGEVYQEAQQLLADENDDEINNYMLPQFVAANFPDRANTPCRKVTEGFGAYDVEIMKQVIQLVGQMNGNLLPVDIRSLLDQAGMPLLSQKEFDATLKQIAKEAEAMQPQPQPPAKVGMQGYNAGVEKTASGMSIYTQPPGRIDLDATHHGSGSILSTLPDVPAYHDAAVRSAMMKLRRLMLDRYGSQVDSFIESLRGQTSLHLAAQAQPQQQNTQGQQQQAKAAAQGATSPTQPTQPAGLTPAQATGVANTLVGAWRAGAKDPGAQAAVALILLAIAIRAARRELKLANLGQDIVDEPQLGAWASERSAFVIDSIDSTIDEEFVNFLELELESGTDPEQVAEAAAARFADTAQTHADRVVLAESLPAYNRGALSAFRDAGVGIVMAHDASDGADHLTDGECQSTNGLTMSVEEALSRAADEHPRGTLWFSPLSVDAFNVVRGKIPAALNGKPGQIAAWDERSNTLFLGEEVSAEQESEYRLVIGDVLRIR